METEDVLALIERIDNSGLSRFKLRDGEFELEIERHSGAAVEAVHRDHSLTAQSGGQNQRREDSSSASEELKAEEPRMEAITSPIVGSFYRAPSPDAPPYVEPGTEVKQGQTLCVIEAMKVMNELEADFPCRIVRVLAENQQMVEYGTPLFEVERLE